MIASWLPFLTEVMAACALMAASFVLGVGYACYRAVGWADRMRAWAAGVDEAPEDCDGSHLAGRVLDSLGVN